MARQKKITDEQYRINQRESSRKYDQAHKDDYVFIGLKLNKVKDHDILAYLAGFYKPMQTTIKQIIRENFDYKLSLIRSRSDAAISPDPDAAISPDPDAAGRYAD